MNLASGSMPSASILKGTTTNMTPAMPGWGSLLANGSNTFYATVTETTTALLRFANAATIAAEYTVSELAVKKVTAPSATGVTIVSEAGGAVYNWAAKDVDFNYNDSSYLCKIIRG
jgi:hypothetical protein